MTDNAWAYKSSLREVCAELGAGQAFIKPHCPRQNGKVWSASTAPCRLSGPTARSSPATPERAAALAPWLEDYNTRRRHSALGGLPPISRLSPT
ncbi:integrase core domain-containing protein [Nocardioides sp. MAHUQ-72]|uniref:integrase core domain-containing protein n=1 Tax=unclassified Nocardioides TaxID=2615069 RepID=UPI003615E94B